jgi:hypothetical protein
MRFADLASHRLEGLSGRLRAVALWESEAEPVVVAARNQMDVHMRDLLAGRLPVSDIHTHRLDGQRTVPERAVQIGGNSPEPCEAGSIELRDQRRVGTWYHQEMTGLDWADVHECHDQIVLMDVGRRCGAADD